MSSATSAALLCASALSTRPSWEEALNEVLAMATSSLAQPPNLAVLFCSPHHAAAADSLAARTCDSLRTTNLIGCSGVGQAMLWQIRDPWNSRQHESADGMVYVVGGEGRLKLGEREFTVSAGAFAVVPRGTTYSLSKSGRNPLIVLAVLAGAPCAAD